ncbi:hypothetical protein Taro_004102 [Colocasia esculenta]|uniref:Uncharacterized protein n=1 Tax=Colocasia esculenta TaxID=4460 RepID=A0A843TQR5_COLES|nr:hypothetical protein [Colocasia esculenta]
MPLCLEVLLSFVEWSVRIPHGQLPVLCRRLMIMNHHLIVCFLEIAVMDDGASAFAELRVSTEQYSFAPVGAYIPMPAKEYSAMESTPAGDQVFCDAASDDGVEHGGREGEHCPAGTRASLNQEARDEAIDSEEETAYVRNRRNFRQLTASKVKEVEQPKRKRFWNGVYCLALRFEFHPSLMA